MKSIISLFIIGLYFICPLKGQVFSVAFGDTYIADKSRVKLHPEVLGKGVGGNDDWFYQISYSHWLKKGLFVTGSYQKYPVATLFNFQSETGNGGFGWVGTDMHRFDAGVGWNIFRKTKFIIQPVLNISYQKSIPKGNGNIGIIPRDILPIEFEQLARIEDFSYRTTQLVPVVGIKFGYALWNRLEIFMDIRQVWGFTVVQELRLQYAYKGVTQPDAINYSDGTGRFYALGIGYRIQKPK